MDISALPLQNFKARNPNFPDNQLIDQNFFEHRGNYDLILEQTFFCSFEPTKTNRELYVEKMHELLNPNGKLVEVWFNIPLVEGNMDKRPFGGTKEIYLNYLEKHFKTKTFETCKSSIKTKENLELFGVIMKL